MDLAKAPFYPSLRHDQDKVTEQEQHPKAIGCSKDPTSTMMVPDPTEQPGGDRGSVDRDTELVYHLKGTNELFNELKPERKDTKKWPTRNISSFTKPCTLTHSFVT